MILQQPYWLLMILPLGMLWYSFRLPTRILNVLRGTLLILLVLALAEPFVKLPGRKVTTVVVADRSASMPQETEESQREIISLLHSAMAGDDKLAVVAVGNGASVEQTPQQSQFTGFNRHLGEQRSDLARGIELATSLVPKDRIGRILVVSDGRWTGSDPAQAATKAAAREIPIDYRYLARSRSADLAIQRIQAPSRTAPGESYLITGWIDVPLRQDVQYKLTSGNRTIAAGTKNMKAGLRRIMFRDTAAQSGTKQYVFEVAGSQEDPIPQNNIARKLVAVEGEKPILCVSPTDQSALPRLLSKGGLEVESRLPDQCQWSLPELSNYSAVLLENISATDLGSEAMRNLAAWVEETGGGFMMTGGRNSFGPGGYFKSPLERIMPVSMELRKEHRKLRLAIAVALDRSGSMGASAGGGRTKMDLANLGTVQVLDLLSDMDEIGVLAVDSTPHEIVPMNGVANNRAQRQRILSIHSTGGGIFVYEALAAAVKMLAKAEAGTRHIILFADAADAEQPAAYKKLLEKCAAANITVSVVGLGTPTDSDAELLRDIARRGNGRCFFTANPSEIPRLFAQDTFSVARSTFIEETTALRIAGGWTTLFGSRPDSVPSIGGYNLCYLRADANCAAISEDEYEAPLIASWNVGSGRVLCYAGEADGEFTGPLAQWSGTGDLFSGMARWTIGARGSLPDDMLLTQDIENGICRIELHLDPERDSEPLSKPPGVKILRGTPGEQPEVSNRTMRRQTADLFSCDIDFRGGETIMATVEFADRKPISMAPVTLPYSPEFKPPQGRKGLRTLKAISAATRGGERTDLRGIWEAPTRRGRYVSVTPWILLLALLVFLIEILQRRTGLLSSLVEKGERRKAESVPAAPATSSPATGSRKPSPPPSPEPPKPEESETKEQEPTKTTEDTFDAMRSARKRADKRTQR